MGKKMVVAVLGVIDVALLVVIMVSMLTGWRISSPQTASTVSVATSSPTQSATVSKAFTEAPEPTEASTEAPTKAQAKTPATEQPATEAPKPKYPSPDKLSTDAYPTLGDVQNFKWDKNNGPYWKGISDKAVALTELSAVKGGWMTYILDDPAGKRNKYSVEHFANIKISGSDSSAKLTVDWFYTFLGEEGEGHDDNTPDSEFVGTWTKSDGKLTATGAGKITLSGFCYDNGREYGTGTMMLPDGTEAIIALVRP